MYYVVNFRFIVKDRETFFSSAQRSQIVWQLLMRTSYDDDDSDKVGIVRLLSNGVFKAAYPLHDGAAVVKDDTSQLSSRKVILEQNHKLFKSVPSQEATGGGVAALTTSTSVQKRCKKCSFSWKKLQQPFFLWCVVVYLLTQSTVESVDILNFRAFFGHISNFGAKFFTHF